MIRKKKKKKRNIQKSKDNYRLSKLDPIHIHIPSEDNYKDKLQN